MLPPLDDDRLAAVTRLIEAAGFEASHFAWESSEETHTLLHTPTGYRFSIYPPGRLRFYRVVYRPGAMSEDSFATSIGTWEDVLRLVEKWLRLIVREV